MVNKNLHPLVPTTISQDPQHITNMYASWFLDYASYVILERAIPTIEDGMKPVQRRILHAMKAMEDGRYHKVANIIGQTMQYHPHGDAAIGDALVHLGQKNLLIDIQGNWGDVRTGDQAAAPRYIEARLSTLALNILYSPDITTWQPAYDGRKQEPITLPVKFPLLLAQGVEGIAVGLATKILPHNFCELLTASIAILEQKPYTLLPDFPTGGWADCSQYQAGQRGGKVRVRASIHVRDQHTLVISSVPYGLTTTSLIQSILKANDKGKLHIKKVIDNTAQHVEVLITLPTGQSPETTIDALYALTDCEISLSPNACVISKGKPIFINVHTLLEACTHQTKEVLALELDLQKKNLQEQILRTTLEQLFLENKLYRHIEECETWEAVLDTIRQGLLPYQNQLYRTITTDDILQLTSIKIKRIAKYDAQKIKEKIIQFKKQLKEVIHHLQHLVTYTIAYFQQLLDQYGAQKTRQTEIRVFDSIAVQAVAVQNQILYFNQKTGFMGYGLKQDKAIAPCSTIDDILLVYKDGTFVIKKIDEKVFVGEHIVHIAVFKKNDVQTVFQMMYVDGKTGYTLAKRFHIIGITRDKIYHLTQGHQHSRILYFNTTTSAQAHHVMVYLSAMSAARKKENLFDFAQLAIKGRDSKGNLVTKYTVRKIQKILSKATTLPA